MHSYDEMRRAKELDAARRNLRKRIFHEEIGLALGLALARNQEGMPDFQRIATWSPSRDGGKGLCRWLANSLRQTNSIEATLNGLRYYACKSRDPLFVADQGIAIVVTDLRRFAAAAAEEGVACADEQALKLFFNAVLGWELERLQR